MFGWGVALIGTAAVPLLAVWWANRHTVLVHALFWATLAWLAWLWAAASETADAGYVALGLTGCSGVAVLGARRPGAAAWNAVVAGLFAVQLIPLVQDFLSGSSWLNGPIWKLFLAATITVGLLNYFPTRLGVGAALLLAGCGMQLAVLNQPNAELGRAAILVAGISPWAAALAVWFRRPPAGRGDQLWLGFRERFGFLWSQRLREQFNAAAHHAALEIELGWAGLRRTDAKPATEADQSASRELLSALTQRFGLP